MPSDNATRLYTWTRLQNEVDRWVKKNFPESPPRLGELAHAHLKREQGIRGSVEEHTVAARDAVADSVIFFMHACANLGWGSRDLLRTASPEEFQRTFSVPIGRSPVVQTIKGLSNFVEQLELADVSPTAIEKDAHLAAAQNSALFYLSGLAAYCTQMRWSLQDIIDETWPKVRSRDWTRNKTDGGAVPIDIDPVTAPVKVSFGDPLKDYDSSGRRIEK